jgi:hypothetical protein
MPASPTSPGTASPLESACPDSRWDWVDPQLAKQPCKYLVLLDRQVLIPKEQHLMFEPGLTKADDDIVAQRLA